MADLNALVVFAKVVEAKSFSEAARRLGMPVSTVSRRIAELEDQLGIRLLDRSTRNLRLTDLGLEVLEHAQAAPKQAKQCRTYRIDSDLTRSWSCGMKPQTARPGKIVRLVQAVRCAADEPIMTEA